MPDTKISDLAALTAPAPADLFVIVDVSDVSMAASGTDKKMTYGTLLPGSTSFGWEPANYIGTWAIGTTYAYGDAVRAETTPDVWQIYISKIAGNVGNDPVTDDGSRWIDVVSDGKQVLVRGTENPNSTGEQNRITHYAQDATGGTFDLGNATGIAWDALEAAIQSALDTAYVSGAFTVLGDAADFTVEYYNEGNVLDMDGTNLTGGGITLEADTQALIVGGFIATSGSIYLSADGARSAVVIYDADSNSWAANLYISNGSSADVNVGNLVVLTRTGAGPGSVDFSAVSNRADSGPGDARVTKQAIRQGSGEGDAEVLLTGEVGQTAIGTGSATIQAIHHTGGTASIASVASATEARVEINGPLRVVGPGFRPVLGWQPANYIGSWAIGATYAYGDAVRAETSPDVWQLYVSLLDSNLGNDPVGDALNWIDTVADDKPVVVQGTASPNADGELNRITHYVQDATGGTFAIGNAATVDWDALEAAIQAAIDAEYAVGRYVVVGDADDFTVEAYEDALVFDDTNLTGGGLVSETETQALVVGGFLAPGGSAYLSTANDGTWWRFKFDSLLWLQSSIVQMSQMREGDADVTQYAFRDGAGEGVADAGNTALRLGGGGGNATSSAEATREGTGAGNADTSASSTRADSGDGNATGGAMMHRSGSGAGDASGIISTNRRGSGTGESRLEIEAKIDDTAVGTATVSVSVEHHTGGTVSMAAVADAAGANIIFTGLPTSDPAIAGALWNDAGDPKISAG